eukprot:3518829-Rhodomonas_salina.1
MKWIRLQFLIRTNRILVEKFLTAVYGSDFSKKGSREAEALHHMLITQAIKELLSGTVNSSTWDEKPHCMPAVQMWAKLCFKYEGVSDINSKNLLKDLNAQYPCKANKNLDMSAA